MVVIRSRLQPRARVPQFKRYCMFRAKLESLEFRMRDTIRNCCRSRNPIFLDYGRSIFINCPLGFFAGEESASGARFLPCYFYIDIIKPTNTVERRSGTSQNGRIRRPCFLSPIASTIKGAKLLSIQRTDPTHPYISSESLFSPVLIDH